MVIIDHIDRTIVIMIIIHHNTYGPVRIDEGGMVDIRCAGGSDPYRSTLHDPAHLGDDIIADVTGLDCTVLHSQRPFATGATAVRMEVIQRIIGEVPLYSRTCMVLHGAHRHILHMPAEIPLETTVLSCVLLRKPHIFAGRVMHGGKGANVTRIEMESRTAHVSALRHMDRVFGIVAVMVITDDKHVAVTVLRQRRTQMVLREVIHLLLGPIHTRVVAVVQRFVLDTEGMDGDSLVGHRLEITQQIRGVQAVILRLQRAGRVTAVSACVLLHPYGCSPRGSHDEHIRIDRYDLFKHRQQITQVGTR